MNASAPENYDIDAILSLPSRREAVLELDRKLNRINQHKIKLSEPELTFMAVQELIGNVLIDGFDGWFFNGGGPSMERAYEGLKQYGAVQTAAIVERAMSVFPGGRPSNDYEEYARQMEQLDYVEAYKSFLDDLDTEFFKFKEDLSCYCYEYILNNRSYFRGGIPAV